jgi:N-acetylglutamate synthase-like GNAT family acetyltransferase
MMSFVIRQAGKDDFPSIRALIRKVHINPTQLDWRRFAVAVDPTGCVIGCGQVKPHSDGSRELASLAVEPEYQGSGIGRAILSHLMENQTPPVYLTCRERLESYYVRFGFHSITQEEMPPYFRRIWRIVSVLDRLRGSHKPRMRIMRWDGQE